MTALGHDLQGTRVYWLTGEQQRKQMGELMIADGSRRTAVILLALGALPFAIATCWSVVTPLIALLTLAVGGAAVRPTTRSASPRAASVSRRRGPEGHRGRG